MLFNFLDLFSVEIGPDLPGMGAYFQRELGYFSRPASHARRRLIVSADPRLHLADARPTRSVGNELHFIDGAAYTTDSAGFLCGWLPAMEEGETTIRVHPQFTPYRMLFYVVLPLLKQALNEQRYTFLHASAVGAGGSAIAISGWGGTGKTNTLIRYLESGASYLADDLTIVDAHGRCHAFPRPLNVFDYNLAAFPKLRAAVPAKRRLRMLAAKIVTPLATWMLPNYRAQIGTWRKVSSQVVLDPARLWSCPPETTRDSTTLVLLYRGSTTGIETPPLESAIEAAVANIAYELSPIDKLRYMYAFASGTRFSPLVGEVDRDIIGEFARAASVVSVSVRAGVDAYDLIESFRSLPEASG